MKARVFRVVFLAFLAGCKAKAPTGSASVCGSTTLPPAGAGVFCSGPATCSIPGDFLSSGLGRIAETTHVVPDALGFKLDYIKPQSLLASIGLKRGDIIKRLNGNELSSPELMLKAIVAMKKEQAAVVAVDRAGCDFTLVLTNDGPASAGQIVAPPTPAPAATVEKKEWSIQNGNQGYRLDHVEGWMVDDLQPGSPLAKIGLRQGDVIEKINSDNLTPNDAPLRISALLTSQQSLTVNVVRDGHPYAITFEPPTATAIPAPPASPASTEPAESYVGLVGHQRWREARTMMREEIIAHPDDKDLLAQYDWVEAECLKNAARQLREARTDFAAKNYPQARAAADLALRYADKPTDPEHRDAEELLAKIPKNNGP